MPEVSLNATHIREKLLNWEYVPESINEESILYYGAAHQMVRLIITNSKRSGISDPLGKLIGFLTLQERPVESARILTFIRDEMKVNIDSLGALSEERKDEIAKAAIETFWRERRNAKTGYKYNSLNTFAYMAMPLSPDLLLALIEELYDKGNSDHFKCLAAKALEARMDHTTFDQLQSRESAAKSKPKRLNSHAAFSAYLKRVCEVR